MTTDEQTRECRLSRIKIKAIEKILASRAPRGHCVVPKLVVDAALKELYSAIDGWDGVCLSRVKKQPSSFAEYFKIGKNRWDSMKTRQYIGSAFWLKIFEFVHRVEFDIAHSDDLVLEHDHSRTCKRQLLY